MHRARKLRHQRPLIFLPVCSLQMRHVRLISVLRQAQIRGSSWCYSYSLSLCAEALLFLKKRKKIEGQGKTTASSTTVLSMEAGFALPLIEQKYIKSNTQ